MSDLAIETDIRYRQIAEEALVGIYISTPSGQLVLCNPAFARLLGFGSVEEAIRTPLAAVYATPAERDAFVDRVRASGHVEPQRARLRRRDGQLVDVIETVVGQFDARGGLVELRGQIVDITGTVATEAALVEREEQFRAVFNDATDAIAVVDDGRAILDANPAAQRLFGIAPADFGVRRLDDLFGDAADLQRAWSELLAFGEVRREHRLGSGPHAARLVECSYRAHVRAGGHLCIARDITERRMLEERLQQSEKIETVGRLAGGIAHDFNNLLTAMLGYTELLLANRGPADPERADLEAIQKAGQRAAALTQQLLAFGRKQVLLPKDVDLNDALNGVRSMLARLVREDIELVVQGTPAPALVRIDPSQFEQAVLNVVLNARDALPGGGRIVLGLDRRTISRADVAADGRVPAGEYVRLQVTDNGVGMSPGVRAHLFEPFFTTKALGKGSGLGLAAVYGIVRQSNGYITVESEPGKGTTVAMSFPAVAGVGRAEPAAEAAPPSAHSATILLVEDEDAVRAIVSAVLRRSGFHVLEASTPRGACELFEQHAQQIDLLLTDVVMPEMNGPSLAQRLVAQRPELRVLFISGYADVATSAFDPDNPNTGFLSKPFQASVLIGRVREMLARPRRGAAQ